MECLTLIYLQTEEDGIARRTRSKLPLTTTSLYDIEEAFVAPDITPDMYDTNCDNTEWQDFLKCLHKSGGMSKLIFYCLQYIDIGFIFFWAARLLLLTFFVAKMLGCVSDFQILAMKISILTEETFKASNSLSLLYYQTPVHKTSRWRQGRMMTQSSTTSLKPRQKR